MKHKVTREFVYNSGFTEIDLLKTVKDKTGWQLTPSLLPAVVDKLSQRTDYHLDCSTAKDLPHWVTIFPRHCNCALPSKYLSNLHRMQVVDVFVRYSC